MDQPDNYTITGSLTGGGNGKRGHEPVKILSFNEGIFLNMDPICLGFVENCLAPHWRLQFVIIY